MTAALWFAIALTYAHLVEYAIHRWFMHKPTLGRNRLFTDHHVEHHGKGRNDINISAEPERIAIIASPLLVGCWWLGPWWAVFVGAFSVVYARAWTIIHSAHHDLDYKAITRVPLYGYWRDHHLAHHIRPNRNFGTVFPWTDYFFGTKH